MAPIVEESLDINIVFLFHTFDLKTFTFFFKHLFALAAL